MKRFTERGDLGANKLVLRPTAEPGEHIEPWCVGTFGDGTVTIRGAAVDCLAEYEDTNLTPDQMLELDKEFSTQAKELMKYRKIGSVQECQEARERQVMNKPNIWGDGYDDKGNMIYDMYDCPNCGKSYEIDYEKYKFCPECGQAIDWDRKEREDYDRK